MFSVIKTVFKNRYRIIVGIIVKIYSSLYFLNCLNCQLWNQNIEHGACTFDQVYRLDDDYQYFLKKKKKMTSTTFDMLFKNCSLFNICFYKLNVNNYKDLNLKPII